MNATQSAYFKTGLRLVYDAPLSAQKEKEKGEKNKRTTIKSSAFSHGQWSSNYDSVIWKLVVNWEI